MITVRELLDQLAAEGALAPETYERAAAALAGPRDDATPWYLHLLVAVGSWIAAILLIVFTALTGAVTTPLAAVFVGLVLCAVAVAVRLAVGRVSWLAQVPLALSLAGELMVFAGILFQDFSSGDGNLTLALASLALLELALIVVYRDRLHRFLSVWIIAAALCGILITNDLHLGAAIFSAGLGWAAALLWERESAFARRDALGRPVAYGLVVGLFTCLIILTGDGAPLDWPASIGLALALAYSAWSLLAGAAPLARLAGVAGALTLLAPAWQAPGILAAALVLVVGFSRGSRILVGLGGVFLAGFIGHFYYSLDATLLMKSLYLAGAGLLLLAARAVIQRAAARPGLA